MFKRRLWLIPMLTAAVAAVLVIAADRFRDAPLKRPEATDVERRTETPDAPIDSPIRFDVADVGIDFRYFNSADPTTPGARMFEFTGGGVGVLDYDLDGRPDLHFTQGCRWPPDPAQREHLDRLYRNLGDRYVDATDAAGIVEPGFSQGLACGDFDGDGFSDLYIANIGPNRLFRNNGDGTFNDVTTTSLISEGTRAEAWTTSVALADLNSDGLPELFDVNYVEGHDVFDRICDHEGFPRICSPTLFEAQPDRLLLNRGDGRFTDVTAIAGIDGSEGTGLGIAIADFHGTGRLSLFVANDARNNHFYLNETQDPGGLPRFAEQAMRNGLAFDREGRAQACMGVAVGDGDGDGRIDLFVTNYVEESNTLYVQHDGRLFADDSSRAGLSKPSIPMLGFGTQFLDADLDGWEDLVVVNGHVDDFTHQGYDHLMRPQLFRNLGGRFVELSGDAAGAYFQQNRLGRGLARLDWNGDGRDEFVVSHLDDQASLLSNSSASVGKSLKFHLRATHSARDAVGATVIAEAGRKRLVRQLTAGDGYQASNEPALVFGLGDDEVVDRVTIRWPSGETSGFQHVATGSTWLAIEGRRRLLRLQ
ncbi:MAG: CRTAC1 family protein [Planctomycetaceae bacterium]